MKKKIGFIGCGKMAQAMIEGMLQAEILLPEQIIASAASNKTLDDVKQKFNIQITNKNEDVAQISDILILAVKPNLYHEVIQEIADVLKENSIIVTIAAGVSLRFMEEAFGRNVKVVRTMPNTPSLVREGMTALCVNEFVTKSELEDVFLLLNSFGKAEMVEEQLMDAVPAISGSSPAYVYMLIEAMADGGVLQGIPREKAYRLAAQAVLGAAKMVLETGMHPGMLKDNVCTPGGSTIEAVATLEKNHFRSSIIEAMESCTKKSVKLSEK